MSREALVSAMQANKGFQEEHFMQFLELSVAKWKKIAKQVKVCLEYIKL